MKSLLFAFALIPFSCFAQTGTSATSKAPEIVCTKYEYANMNGPYYSSQYTKSEDAVNNAIGDVRFERLTSFTIGAINLNCLKATTFNTRERITANGVKLIVNNQQYPIFSADELTYSPASGKAILKGHITMEQQGHITKMGDEVTYNFATGNFTASKSN